MNDTHSEFIVVSREHLTVFEQSLLSLEKAASGNESRSLIEHGLRAVHSMKGDSGFLGFTTIRQLAHAMESLLEDYRDGARLPSTEIVEALLAARDQLAALVEDLDQNQQAAVDDLTRRLLSLEGTMSHAIPLNINLRDWQTQHSGSPLADLFARLDAFGIVENPQIIGLPDPSAFGSETWTKNCNVNFSGVLITKASPNEIAVLVGVQQPPPFLTPDGFERRVDLGEWQTEHKLSLVELFHELTQAGEIFDQHLKYSPTDLTMGLPTEPIIWQGRYRAAQPVAPPETTDMVTLQDSAGTPQPRPESPVKKAHISNGSTADKDRPASPKTAATPDTERLRSLRINVELLDRLMNLIGELTLIRNQTQVAFSEQEGESRNLIQRLNSVTSELQGTVLQTRMQPVGNLFGRFPRMVRDLARQLGKEVEVITIGQDVELDKTVIERLSDPLTHLIRNSIDHGLESPEAREAVGKSRIGQIVLSATPTDGQVCIEIRDDGRGIDPVAVKAKAAAMGLRTESELERMSNRELFSLILLPGFSTAKQVTDVSGRGVGMDVVKTNIDELEGHLTIDSKLGHGTSMNLRVPLTLAIVPCLIVTVGNDRFALAQRELEEIVCLHPGGKRKLEHAFDTEVFRLRDSLLPVIRFSEILARSQPFSADDKAEILAKYPPAERDPAKIEYILVLRSNGKRFGLLVDQVQGREEIVVKPIHAAMRKVTIFSGATLMGDGRVALIANAVGIIEHARCFAAMADDVPQSIPRNPHEVHRVLLFEYGANEQYALPLVQVRRVELLDMNRVERIGAQEFVTLDGVSTRILRLNEFMDVSQCEESPTMFLILPRFVPEPMGILAQRIIDTESLAIDLQTSGNIRGVLGTAIVRSRLSLFLDVQQIRESVVGVTADASGVGEPSGITAANDKWRSTSPRFKAKQRILLVDDTPFFREIVKRYLSAENVEIVTGVDGRDGLELLASQDFDLVVSDIEMPNMNGWEFCKTAREKGYRMPFVALTSLAKNEYEQKAMACGFDDFEEKLDHDRLQQKVLHWLQRSLEMQVPQ